MKIHINISWQKRQYTYIDAVAQEGAEIWYQQILYDDTLHRCTRIE